MTITAVSTSALTGLVAEFGPKKAEAQLAQASKLLDSNAMRRIPGHGEYIVQLYPVGSQSQTWIGDNGRLPDGEDAAPIEAKQLPRAIVKRITFGAMSGQLHASEAAAVNHLDKKLDHEMESFAVGVAKSLFGNSVVPQATATWSGTAANSTVTISFLDISLFHPNQIVNFVDTSASLSYTVRVTAKSSSAVGANSANVAGTVTFINDVPNPATGSIVALGATAVAVDDIFAVRGTYPGFGGSATASGHAITSLVDVCSPSAALMGVTPASNPEVQWSGHTMAMGVAYSQEAIGAFATRIASLSNSAPDVFATSPQVVTAHAMSGGQQTLGQVGSPLTGGFGLSAGISAHFTQSLDASLDKYGKAIKGSGYSVAGAEMIGDMNCQVGVGFFFPREKLALCEWKKMGPRADGGGEVVVSRTNYSDDALLDAQVNLVCDKRHACGSVTGIGSL